MKMNKPPKGICMCIRSLWLSLSLCFSVSLSLSLSLSLSPAPYLAVVTPSAAHFRCPTLCLSRWLEISRSRDLDLSICRFLSPTSHFHAFLCVWFPLFHGWLSLIRFFLQYLIFLFLLLLFPLVPICCVRVFACVVGLSEFQWSVAVAPSSV